MTSKKARNRAMGQLRRFRIALETIEGLTFEDVKSQNKLGEVYKIAHVALGRCKNKHQDWFIDMLSCNNALKELGIIDDDQKRY